MEEITKLIENDIYNLITKIMNNKNNPEQKTRFNIKVEIENQENKEESVIVECEFNLLKFNNIIIQ